MSDPKSQPATPDAPPQASFEWSQSPFEAFLEQHFKKVLLGLGLAAAAVAGYLVFQQKQEEKLTAEAQAFTGAETIEDLKKVITAHPDTVAAGSAQLMMANLLAKNSDYAGAIEELNTFVSKYPNHPVVDQGAFRAAVLTIEKGDVKDGIAKLESFLAKYPESPLRVLAQLRKADALYQDGQKDKAVELYEALTKDNSINGNPVREEINERLGLAKLKPPVEVEFVPEPTPPAPAPGTPGGPPNPPNSVELNAPSLSLDGPPPSPEPKPEPAAPAPTPEPAPAPAPAPTPAPGQ